MPGFLLQDTVRHSWITTQGGAPEVGKCGSVWHKDRKVPLSIDALWALTGGSAVLFTQLLFEESVPPACDL